jgi:enoyl-CoA hydratase
MDNGHSTVQYVHRDSIAYITLNRPEAMNALNHALIADLDHALDRVRDDETVKAAVITGAGERAFCAGADLKQLHGENMMQDAGRHLRFTAKLRDLFVKVTLTPVPVIAVIRGYALAGGLELALSCDLILCSDDAQIGDEHANRFLIAGAGGTQRLPRKIGMPRALELLFTGRRLTGPEAVAYGLALRSYPPAELDAAVQELVASLRGKSRTGLGLTKEVVRRGHELPLREALDLERLTVQEYFSCYPDAAGGVSAFNQARPSRA